MGRGRKSRAKAEAKAKAVTTLPAAEVPHISDPPSLLHCSENIALLHLLREVHDAPTRNPAVYDDNNQQEDSRCLPFREERAICGVFAFFASTNDDPNIIPVVCLEEDPATASLRVLLSVNKAKPSDGHDIMIKVEKGFERIWNALSRITGGCLHSYQVLA
jgi:hypothetical protein